MAIQHRASFIALVVAGALAGCGGGGGGSSDPVSAEQNALTVPLTTALANYISQIRHTSASVSGEVTTGGQSFAVSGSAAATESTSADTFEGQSALHKLTAIEGSISVSGIGAPISNWTHTYYDSNYGPLGAASSGSYCVTTSSSPIPATARAGDSGPWYTQSCYSSTLKTTLKGTGTTTYVVEPDTANTLLLKLVSTASATGTGLKNVPVQSTFRVGRDGAISRVEDTTAINLGVDSLVLTITYR
jgi:hypothetical protein